MSPDPGNPVIPDQPPVKPTPQPIWIVSQIQTRDYKCDISHGVAFYYSLEDARGCLQYLDTETGWYTHVVIEMYTPGYLAYSQSEEWYQRNPNDDGWVLGTKPEDLSNVVHFGLG
jgi:hypothetical protein